MINIVELMVDNEFMDIDALKSTFLHGIREYLSSHGYDVTPVDRSEWYSFERKLLVDTNAPEPYISRAVEAQNEKQKDVYGVLIN
ncbi:hypothetical protein [Methanocella conradii]|uniref:hypothetical protein n=1 Tax=Methanocella conradii TaxID=1175444 RepID=UPI0020C700E1|nr:hypothetical protein [Methanocella conradii]